MMTCCTGWWMWVIPLVILWWLFTSMVVYYAWNHVIVAVTSARAMQFKHAFILVFALTWLAAPHHAQGHWKKCCKDRMMQQDMPMEMSAPQP